MQNNHTLTRNTFSVQQSDIRFDDLIEKQPGWLLYSGIPLIFLSSILCIGLAAFIHYPDRLAATFILTTLTPPVGLTAPVGGQIGIVYFKEGQAVRQGEKIIYFDNPASLDDVKSFARIIDSLYKIEHMPDFLKMKIPENLQMGELRQTYTECVQILGTFQTVLKEEVWIFKKKHALKDKISKHEQLSQALQIQLSLFEKELALSEKDYRRNAELNRQGIVSDLDYERLETQYLRLQQQHESLKAAVIQNQAEKAQLHMELLSVKYARVKDLNEFVIRLNELILRFRNEYNTWQKKYFIEAPADGIFSLTPGIVVNQPVQAGDIVANLIPGGSQNPIVARIGLRAEGIGNIERSNKVLLQLDAFPYKEYGHIESKVDAISLLPVEDREGKLYYEVTCRLPDTLISSIGKPLSFRQRLTGTAQVITKDRSLLSRLLDKLLTINS